MDGASSCADRRRRSAGEQRSAWMARVTRHEALCLLRARSARRSATQYPCRQQHQCAQERKYTIDRNAEQAQWQQHQPDDRIQDQREQRQRPAEDEQQHPKQERQHRYSTQTWKLRGQFRACDARAGVSKGIPGAIGCAGPFVTARRWNRDGILGESLTENPACIRFRSWHWPRSSCRLRHTPPIGIPMRSPLRSASAISISTSRSTSARSNCWVTQR